MKEFSSISNIQKLLTILGFVASAKVWSIVLMVYSGATYFFIRNWIHLAICILCALLFLFFRGFSRYLIKQVFKVEVSIDDNSDV